MSPYNKLHTKTAFAKVPALYATEKIPADEKIAHVKIFCITDDQRWYVLEYDPETGKAFCLHTNLGDSSLGYSIINDPGNNWEGEDMQALNNRRARSLPPFERDAHFSPTSVADIKANLAQGNPA
jgi:hypothetical protein